MSRRCAGGVDQPVQARIHGMVFCEMGLVRSGLDGCLLVLGMCQVQKQVVNVSVGLVVSCSIYFGVRRDWPLSVGVWGDAQSYGQ